MSSLSQSSYNKTQVPVRTPATLCFPVSGLGSLKLEIGPFCRIAACEKLIDEAVQKNYSNHLDNQRSGI